MQQEQDTDIARQLRSYGIYLQRGSIPSTAALQPGDELRWNPVLVSLPDRLLLDVPVRALQYDDGVIAEQGRPSQAFLKHALLRN